MQGTNNKLNEKENFKASAKFSKYLCNIFFNRYLKFINSLFLSYLFIICFLFNYLFSIYSFVFISLFIVCF